MLIFLIVGLLYLLRFERVDNLGAYRIPPETGILIPNRLRWASWGMRCAGAGNLEARRRELGNRYDLADSRSIKAVADASKLSAVGSLLWQRCIEHDS